MQGTIILPVPMSANCGSCPLRSLCKQAVAEGLPALCEAQQPGVQGQFVELAEWLAGKGYNVVVADHSSVPQRLQRVFRLMALAYTGEYTVSKLASLTGFSISTVARDLRAFARARGWIRMERGRVKLTYAGLAALYTR